ncbi:MAG: polysaccharide biosynthesis C-terminal domain-containing protein [Nitrososphaeria archaeon]
MNTPMSFASGWLGISVLYAVTGSLSVIVAYYMVSASAGILSIAYSPITSVLFPYMSYRHGERGPETIGQTLGQVEGIIVFTVLSVSLFAAGASRPLIELFYGRSYAADSLAFSILSAGLIFSALATVYSTALQSMKMTHLQLFSGGISVGALLALLAVLSRPLGANGVAASAVISSAIGATISYALIKARSGHRIGLHFRKIATPIMVLLVLYVAQPFFGFDSPLKDVVFDAAVYLIALVILSKLLRPLTPEEKSLLRATLPSYIRWIVGLV